MQTVLTLRSWVILLLLVALWFSPAMSPQQAQAMDEVAMPDLVGWLKLDGPLRDGPVPFAWVSDSDLPPTVEDVLQQLAYVAGNDRFLGVVIYLDQPRMSLTQANAIAQAIKQVRNAGKTVLAFSEAYDTQTYLLASAADKVLLQHRGMVMLHGLALEEMYLAGLLEKIGVEADLIQVGRFKGADEQFTRKGPSEAWSENIDALLDDLYDRLVSTIAANRGMDVPTFEQRMAESWTLDDAALVRSGLVDQLVSRDLLSATEVAFGNNFIWDDRMGKASGASFNPENPFAMLSMLFKQPEKHITRPSIAIVNARGVIHSGESSMDGGMFGSASIGSRTMIEMLGKIADNPNIRGAVISLDSPGGSALASEVIWQAVREVSEKKPIYVSINGMAASGGYYIACAADEIYVEPESILGSIGVVGGKLTLGGLYEWLGVDVYRRSRGPLADMFNSVEPFTEQQRAIVRKSMQQTYDQFVSRIETGRGNRLENIDRVAQGRLFTGQQAVKNGMADRVGNVSQAVEALANQLQLVAGEYETVNLPAPMSLADYLNNLFGVQKDPGVMTPVMQHAVMQAGEQMLNPQVWMQIRTGLDGLILLKNEPVITLMPTVLIVR